MTTNFLNDSILYFLLAFLISLVGTKLWIQLSEKRHWGQPIREEGNAAHFKKQGTPTMGGVVFTVVFLFLILILSPSRSMELVIITLGTLSYFLVGLVDDIEKVKKEESEGLTPKQKLAVQFLLAGLLVTLALINNPDLGAQHLLFVSQPVQLGLLWVFIDLFIIVGTVNAVNLTDGLDGLCAGVSIPVFLTIGACAFIWDGPFALGTMSAIIFAGALLGFLFFNAHPAQLFMGDAGSMAIGGAIVSLLLIYGRLVFLLVLGGIYFIEALSDIIQILYFKKSGGKRIFRMAPIHHHFELGGMAEEKIVSRFSIISLILCLMTLLLI